MGTKMSDENKDVEQANKSGRVLVKILKAFMYNGSFVREGGEIDMNEDRAVNHMRAGDVERDEELIQKIKDRRTAAAQAAIADAGGDW